MTEPTESAKFDAASVPQVSILLLDANLGQGTAEHFNSRFRAVRSDSISSTRSSAVIPGNPTDGRTWGTRLWRGSEIHSGRTK